MYERPLSRSRSPPIVLALSIVGEIRQHLCIINVGRIFLWLTSAEMRCVCNQRIAMKNAYPLILCVLSYTYLRGFAA